MDFGLSYTWSKAMNYQDDDADAVSALVSPRILDYGLAGYDRTHILKLNFVWTLPKSLARYALNDWFISGIATMSSGAPTAIGYSFANAGGADLVDGGSQFAEWREDVLAELSDGARAAAGCGYDWEFGADLDSAAGISKLGVDGGEGVSDYREGADAVAGGVL